MRLVRIRSTNPKQVATLKRQLRSAGYLVESIGLSTVSPWRADLELLLETTPNSPNIEEPAYRLFLSKDNYGSVHGDIAQAIASAHELERREKIEAATPKFDLASPPVALASTAVLVVLLLVGFLILISASKVREKDANPQFLSAATPVDRPATSTPVEQPSRKLTPIPLKAASNRAVQTFQEPEVVVTHFDTRIQARNSHVKRFTDLPASAPALHDSPTPARQLKSVPITAEPYRHRALVQ